MGAEADRVKEPCRVCSKRWARSSPELMNLANDRRRLRRTLNFWALMKLCVEHFPPSLALENWLEFFLLKCNRYECLSGLHKTIVRFKAEKDLGKEALER